MNKKLITSCVLIAGAASAQAQTNVTLFGLVDTTVRYSTHENAAGDHKFQMTDGVLTGSRWGVRGVEDLGGGTKAVVVLESGFAPDTGAMLQGGRLFGRQGYVGLDGGYGKLLLGRQYTLAHDALASFEAFAFANNAIVGYQGGNYTGLRHDNMVKYSKALGDVTVNAGYTFGEVAGDTAANSAKAVSATYASGPLYVGAVYQSTNNVSAAFFNAVAAAQASKQTVWGIGGSYQFAPAKVYLGYTNSKLDVANYQNDVLYASFNYALAPSTELIGTLQHDKLKHPGADGTRLTSAMMLDYYLSKRTDIYVEVDYTKLKNGWVGLANNAGLGSQNVFGNDNRAGLMVGVRHKF
jgi:predicted porin